MCETGGMPDLAAINLVGNLFHNRSHPSWCYCVMEAGRKQLQSGRDLSVQCSAGIWVWVWFMFH
jgi:hypothetical protein